MQIAPGIDSSEWHSLQLDDIASPQWHRAIEVFRARIIGRYSDAADLLIDADSIKPPTERRFGFVVMAIDCLLIETLAAFRKGLTDTRDQSKAIFSDFLATQPYSVNTSRNRALNSSIPNFVAVSFTKRKSVAQAEFGLLDKS